MVVAGNETSLLRSLLVLKRRVVAVENAVRSDKDLVWYL
jgi:hypothetical protein